MSDMRKFTLSKKIPYFGYKVYAAKQFHKEDLIPELQKRCCYVNDLRTHSFDNQFEVACLSLITMAQKAVKDWRYKPADTQVKRDTYVKDIYNALSFKDLQEAQKYLYSTPYIKDDYVFNLLEYTYNSLIFTDPQVERRFRVCWELWQNGIEFGTAGLSMKTGKFLPYTLTRFNNRIYLINPIKGEVRFFDRRKGELRGKTVTGISVGKGTMDDGTVKSIAVAHTSDGSFVPLLELDEDSGQIVQEYNPTCVSGINRKKSEQEKLKAQGRDITDNCYLTTDLDIVDGSAYNIRTHSLIALAVYGLEIMKYGVMEHNSIFTIDHINGVATDNRIDNLQLLTRTDNESKQKNPDGWYFDYFGYWVKQLNAGKKNQEYYDYRSSMI